MSNSSAASPCGVSFHSSLVTFWTGLLPAELQPCCGPRPLMGWTDHPGERLDNAQTAFSCPHSRSRPVSLQEPLSCRHCSVYFWLTCWSPSSLFDCRAQAGHDRVVRCPVVAVGSGTFRAVCLKAGLADMLCTRPGGQLAHTRLLRWQLSMGWPLNNHSLQDGHRSQPSVFNGRSGSM